MRFRNLVGQFSNKYLGVSIAFVGPNPYSFVSGGNLYNSHILDSLQSVGIQVIFPQNNRFPKSVEKANLVLIDSIFLKDPNFKMIKTLNTTKWLLYHLPTFIQDSSCVPIDEIAE
ncbi:MAG: hypothetical protein D6732_20255 [Methanobacteriota archaeon]|nr:MAG: hypothetical protein D6732_20255 [Euryarchaeota archaeon]